MADDAHAVLPSVGSTRLLPIDADLYGLNLPAYERAD
jgi:hypothetical protein